MIIAIWSKAALQRESLCVRFSIVDQEDVLEQAVELLILRVWLLGVNDSKPYVRPYADGVKDS